MKKTDDLFDLVKSLNRNEKRFFKLYAQIHSHNKTPYYVYLFDIFDKMEVFDEKKIKKSIKKTIPNKNLGQLRKYLKESIYNSLKMYHKKNDIINRDLDEIMTARILSLKNLPKQAERVLLKLKKKAVKEANLKIINHINTELITLSLTHFDQDFQIGNKVLPYYQESLANLKQEETILKLDILVWKGQKLYRSKAKLGKNILQDLKDILEETLVQINPKKIDNPYTKFQYYHHLSFIYYIVEDFPAMLSALKEIESFIQAPHFKIRTGVFALLYANLLCVYTRLKLKEEWTSTLLLFSKLLEEDSVLQTRFLYWKYYRMIEFYTEFPNQQNEMNSIDVIIEQLEAAKIKLNQSEMNSLWLEIAKYYLSEELYDECYNNISKITLTQKLPIDNYFLYTLNTSQKKA